MRIRSELYPDPLAVLMGLLLRGGEGREVGKGDGKGEEGNRIKGRFLMQIPGFSPASVSA